MLYTVPISVAVVFGLTTVLAVWLFLWAVRNAIPENSRKTSYWIFFGLLAWMILQALLSLNGVYVHDPKGMPPKIVPMGVLPAMLGIAFVFITPAGRGFIDRLPLKHLTLLHVVRIPVELVLFSLAVHKAIPELMTFEGRNFDILAGISAPLVAYFCFTKKTRSRHFLLVWNIVCLGLLFNIVLHAILSVPSPFQKMAFDQPNIAVLYFPFSWLPTVVVPLVLFSHLAAIRQLITKRPI